MENLLILVLALSLDLVLGDPPDFLHPVAWMGKTAALLEKGNQSRRPAARFLYGTGLVLFIIALFAVPAYTALVYLKSVNSIAYVIGGAVIFKTTFSFRDLRRTALGIMRLLRDNNLEQARFELRGLVHRDARHLTRPLLVSAAVESVAENASDSFVAPLFYFLLFGIPGAVAYRVVNTLDAMLGHHGKYEYLGKFAARLDDVLNIIPARLTALLLVLAAFLSRKDGRAAWYTASRDHANTESPNAGWPMAAVAGALDVQLEKRGHYKLGRGNALLTPETIGASVKLLQLTALLWVVISIAVGGIQIVLTS